MNTLLISSAEALSLAFTPAEFQREELIPAVTIETAQLRYLKPAFGPLYDCLNEPRYEAFVERHPEDFPEYDPDLGIRRRVLFKGGLILPDDRP